MKVLIVGAGKMVESILAGLPADVISQWGILSKSGTTARSLAEKYGTQFVDQIGEFPRPDWIILGVKPQQIKDVTLPDVPVLSLLAAIPEKTQKEILKVTHLVRAMPNLPVKFRKGVILLSSTSKPLLKWPEELFSTLGLVKIMGEEELEELTLLSGSGPALFYEFAKTLSQSFSSLSETEREEMVRAVLSGSAMSLKDESLQSMIDAVTSKGGVTIAVLEEWRRSGLSDVLKKGVVSGLKRTEELKAPLLQN